MQVAGGTAFRAETVFDDKEIAFVLWRQLKGDVADAEATEFSKLIFPDRNGMWRQITA
jgi:hypothetical protein